MDNLDKSDICMSNNLNKHAPRCDRDHIEYLAFGVDRCQTPVVDLPYENKYDIHSNI